LEKIRKAKPETGRIFEPVLPYGEQSPTESKAFKKWFGDSKVVDENGNPLVVYHGADKSFTEFNMGKSGLGSGVDTGAFWFTDAVGVTQEFGDKSMPLYVAIKNPLVIDKKNRAFKDQSEPVSIINNAKKQGYDGVIINDVRDGMFLSNVYAVFEPTQIKSIYNRGAFDPTDPNILAEPVEPYGQKILPTFYSQALNVVQTKFPNSMNALSVKSWLTKNQVKPEEMRWLDIEGLLEGKKRVTNEELLDWINSHEIVVTEVMKKSPDETRYTEHQLPGGENYRELLLTLPTQRDKIIPVKVGKEWYLEWPNGSRSEVGYSSKKWAEKAIQESQERLGKGGAFGRDTLQTFTGGHYEEPNVLAHIRFNERVDPDGKKVLFIEEIQSDWHQAGAKSGYKKDMPEDVRMQIKALSAKHKELADQTSPMVDVHTDPVAQRLRAEIKRLGDPYSGTTPDAPFKKNWHKLALKRMLRYAAENGYDKLAWTTGKQQSDRYNLSKYIDRIEYFKPKDAMSYYTVDVYDKGGNAVHTPRPTLTKEELVEMFGKDVAARMVAGKGKQSEGVARMELNERGETVGIPGTRYTLTGLDLTIGGEGMRAFYDMKIPAYLKKYGKRFGAKVGKTTLEYSQNVYKAEDIDQGMLGEAVPAEGALPSGKEPREMTVSSIDITSEMRESVMGGQKVFEPLETYGKLTELPFTLTTGKKANEADFWIQRVGNNAGRPLKKQQPTAFGIKVDESVLDKDKLYSIFQMLKEVKAFEPYIHGTAQQFLRKSYIETILKKYFAGELTQDIKKRFPGVLSKELKSQQKTVDKMRTRSEELSRLDKLRKRIDAGTLYEKSRIFSRDEVEPFSRQDPLDQLRQRIDEKFEVESYPEEKLDETTKPLLLKSMYEKERLEVDHLMPFELEGRKKIFKAKAKKNKWRVVKADDGGLDAIRFEPDTETMLPAEDIQALIDKRPKMAVDIIDEVGKFVQSHIGDLKETWLYESQSEGQEYENYLTELWQLVKGKEVSDGGVQPRKTEVRAGQEQAKSISKRTEQSSIFNREKSQQEIEFAYGSEEKAKQSINETAIQARNDAAGLTNDSLRRQAGTVRPKGQTAPEKLQKIGFIDFRGVRVSTPREVVEAFQVFRNKNIELFHVLLLDDAGTVLSHTLRTAGRVEGAAITLKMMRKDILRAKRVGATRLQLLHNHPAGNPKPSGDDGDAGITATYTVLAQSMSPDLKVEDHIVIDHGKFARLKVGNVSRIGNRMSYRWDYTEHEYTPTEEFEDIGIKINEDQAAISHFESAIEPDMPNNKIALMITDASLQLKAVEYLSRKKNLSDYNRTIYQHIRQHNGSQAIIIGNDIAKGDSIRGINTQGLSTIRKVVAIINRTEDGEFVNITDEVSRRLFISYPRPGTAPKLIDTGSVGKSFGVFEPKQEFGKKERQKALARAHILQKEKKISNDDARRLKKDLLGVESLKDASQEQIQDYNNYLNNIGLQPVTKKKPPKRPTLEELRQKTRYDEAKLVKRVLDRIGHNIVQIHGDARKYYSSMERELNRMGDGGKEVVRLLRFAQTWKEDKVKPFEAELERLWKKVPHKEKEVMRLIIESGGEVEGKLSDATKKFLQWYRDVDNDIFNLGKELINPDIKYVPDHFPLVLKNDIKNLATKRGKHPQKWKDLVTHTQKVLNGRTKHGQMEAFVDPVSYNEAELYVENFLEWYNTHGLRKHFIQQVFQPEGKFRHSYPLELHRDRIFPDWAYSNDVASVLHSYIDHSYNALAYAKYLEKMTEEYSYEKIDELIEQIKNDGHDYETARDFVTATLRLKMMEPYKSRAVRFTKNVTAFLLSPKTGVKNMSDLTKAAAWTNNLSMVESLLKRYILFDGAERKLAKDLIGSRQVFTQSLEEAGISGQFARKWTRLIGFTASEGFVRKQTGHSAIKLANMKLKNWNPDSSSMRNRFIKRNLERLTGGQVDLKKAKERGRFTHFEELTIGNLAIQATQPTSALDKPYAWETSAQVQVATTFKSFGHKNYRFLKDFVLKEMRQGNPGPFFRWALWRTATGYGINVLYQFMFPKDEDEEAKALEKIILESFQEHDLGIINDLIYTVRYSWWASPFIGLVFGPFWSFTTENVMVTAEFINKVLHDKEGKTKGLKRQLGKYTIKRVPFVGEKLYDNFIGRKKKKPKKIKSKKPRRARSTGSAVLQ
jgi:hypothetical protein